MIGEICFEFGDEVRAVAGEVAAGDLDRFLRHVQTVVHVYERVVSEPPGGLTAEQALRAAVSMGSRRILRYARVREELDALITRRHEQTSVADAVSLGDLTAMTLAVKRRYGVRTGLSGSVELARAVMERLFPVRFTHISRTRASESERVEDRLVPDQRWRPALSREHVIAALRQAGRGGVTALWAQEAQAADDDGSGEVTLYVHLGLDEGTGQLRIALVDLRAPRPVEVLSEPEWTSGPDSLTWAAAGLKTQMIVLDGAGQPVDIAAEASALSQPTAAPDPGLHLAGSPDAFDAAETVGGVDRPVDIASAAGSEHVVRGEFNTASQAMELPTGARQNARSAAFLDAYPRKNAAPVSRISMWHVPAISARNSAQYAFQPLPATQRDLREAIHAVRGEVTAPDATGKVQSRTELENCVELAEGLLRRLFPGGIRVPRTLHDLALGTGQIHDRLVPGAPWSPLTSQGDVRDSLYTAGPDSVAVLLEQSQQDKGHVTLYVHAGLHPDSKKPQILRLDPQSRNPVRLLVEDQSSGHSSERWIHAGRGTRMIVINGRTRAQDGTGLTETPAFRTPQSLSTPHALSLPPTSTSYGAIGWEIEFNDQPVTAIDNSDLEYGTVLATNINGTRLLIDQTKHYHFGGKVFFTPDAAREAVAREAAPKGTNVYVEVVKILELASPPYQVSSGEEGRYENWSVGFAKTSQFRERLRLPGREGRIIPLTDLLPRSEGWVHKPEAIKILVHPNLGGQDPRYYVQVTVGANIGGASFLLEEVQGRLPKDKAAFYAMATTREFANEVTTMFATKLLGRTVDTNELPLLYPVVPDLLQMDAYAWLMFNHASAIPLNSRFFDLLTKNMLPAALRNPFYKLRRSLNSNVRSFLVNEERFIVERFEHHLMGAVATLSRRWREKPGAANILDDVSHKGVKVRTYLDSMIRGTTKVGQYETVAMDDYEELDSVNGEMPLALFELRLLDRPAGDAERRDVIGWLHGLANKIHTVALRSKQPISASRELANKISNNPLATEMRGILSILTSLHVSNAHGDDVLLISRFEYLTIGYTLTDHLVYGWPLPPEVLQYLETANAYLDTILAPGAHSMREHRMIYGPIAARLRAVLPALRAAAGVYGVAPRASRAGERRGVDGSVVSEGLSPAASVGVGRFMAVGPEPVVGWDVVRGGAVVRRAEGVWMDPVSRPVGVGGRHGPRFVVESGFDVRRFEVEGVRFTDLTVRYELVPGVGVSPGEVDGLWERALAGVERVFNAGEAVFEDGRVLHVTLQRVDAGGDPHARVTVVAAGGVMDQFRWPVDAPLLGPAHEVGHQVGLRDVYPEEGAEQRGEEGAAGHLMGFFDLPAAEGLVQGGVRPRDLAIIRVQADEAQDLEAFRRSRAAREAAGKSQEGGVAPSSSRAGVRGAPVTQMSDDYDHFDPANPRNVLTIEHLERGAGLLNQAGQPTKDTAKAKALLIAAAKKKRPAGTARKMDDVVAKTGRELLLGIQRHAGTGRSLDLFRAMSFEEARGVLEYWNGPDRIPAEQYVATGRGTAKEFKQHFRGMTLGAHLGGQQQAGVYHMMNGASYDVLLKFTLKPGAHTVMFDPRFMALGPGYHAELIRKAGRDYQAANQNEGTLPGYIGVKAEQHGAFSLSLAQGTIANGSRTVGPSQLLFQLMVETVTLVSNKSGILLPGQHTPTPPLLHAGPSRTTPRAPRTATTSPTIDTNITTTEATTGVDATVSPNLKPREADRASRRAAGEFVDSVVEDGEEDAALPTRTSRDILSHTAGVRQRAVPLDTAATRRSHSSEDPDPMTGPATVPDVAGEHLPVESEKGVPQEELNEPALVPGRWNATNAMFVLDPDLLSPVSSALAEQVTAVRHILAERTTMQGVMPKVGYAATSPDKAMQFASRTMQIAGRLAKHLDSVHVVLSNGLTITVCKES
ncbi:hypothetical protein [Streptomyces sp. NBC_01455]|uniref:hypothetical protein n=1 Tax=Streptomyces sp. NBC_01455 TaxID=2903874 RepID=UPI002E32CCC5|nr:hypothetical protein [Streptomyces sp. NBC_01455]